MATPTRPATPLAGVAIGAVISVALTPPILHLLLTAVGMLLAVAAGITIAVIIHAMASTRR